MLRYEIDEIIDVGEITVIHKIINKNTNFFLLLILFRRFYSCFIMYLSIY